MIAESPDRTLLGLDTPGRDKMVDHQNPDSEKTPLMVDLDVSRDTKDDVPKFVRTIVGLKSKSQNAPPSVPIHHSIEKKTDLEYADVKMQAFCEMYLGHKNSNLPSGMISKSTQTYTADKKGILLNPSHETLNDFKKTVFSSNGKYVGVLTNFGLIYVFNLTAKANEVKVREIKNVKSDIPMPSETIRDSVFSDTDKFALWNSKIISDLRNAALQNIQLCFSPDCSLLIVSTSQETSAFNIEGIFVSQEKEIQKAVICQNAQDRNIDERVWFQYFYRTTYLEYAFMPIDREVLVIGFEKRIKLVYFVMDNFFKSDKNFLPPFKSQEIETTDKNYMFATSSSVASINVWHNSSNLLFVEKESVTKRRKLTSYRLDVDVNTSQNSLTKKYEYDVPSSLVLFPRTFSASGRKVYCYNLQSSEIQLIKFKEENDKIDTESVLKLTGRRKNLIHFAAKDDGKYLLIVDSNFQAEVFLKSSTGYTLISQFIANESSDDGSSQVTKKSSKGLTEHDLTDMDFLEDGSGTITIQGSRFIHHLLYLPQPLKGYCLYNNGKYNGLNLRKRIDGTFSVWQVIKDKKYQKTIDFNPPKEGGCIVRTISKADTEDYKAMTAVTADLYVDGLLSETQKNINTEINAMEDREQLKKFLQAPPTSGEVVTFSLKTKVNNPIKINKLDGPLEEQNSSEEKIELIYLPSTEKLLSFKYSTDKPEDRNLGWTQNCKMETSEDVWKNHLNLYVDPENHYYIKPNKEGGATILGPQNIPLYNKGSFFFAISKSAVLVSIKGKANALAVLGLNELDGNENSDIKEPQNLPSNQPYSHMVETKDPNIKALIGHNTFGLYNISTKKLFYSNIPFTGHAINTPISLEFDTHCFLQSPDKRYIVMSSFSDCNSVCIYDTNTNLKAEARSFHPALTSRNRNDLLNKWCFSHDSKYLLVVVNEFVVVYSIKEQKNITKVNIEDFTKKGLVLSISLYNNSTELEVAVGFKNNILFQRIPFYPRTQDLLLFTVSKKMNDYTINQDSGQKDEMANSIAEIMSTMPPYQRYLDFTYLKLLCLFNHERPARKMTQTRENREVVFKYSPYAKLVTVEEEMKKDSVNCFIDLLEYTVENDKKLPKMDDRILFDWLKSGKLNNEYNRKLMNLITFSPRNVEIQGELKHEFKLMTQVKEKREDEAIDNFRKTLFKENSPNIQVFDYYTTGLKFDLDVGSDFSLKYFRWMEKMPDEDLTVWYKPIVYFKWYQLRLIAAFYSGLFWCLNILFCAFMAFLYSRQGILIPLIILHVLFIGFELKCLYSKPRATLRNPWNYYDLIIHTYGIICVILVFLKRHDLTYQYSWLRITSFVLISFRGLTMLRIFQATRYKLTMLFQAFHAMIFFLAVFTYMIFIYWFVCLVRTSLVPDGQDTDIYSSIQGALNIAFSNFDAGVPQGIVLTTTVIGEVVLALVLLNYLIAIVMDVYEVVDKDRDLYDVRMLIDVIIEFECFLANSRRIDVPKKYSMAFPRRIKTTAQEDIGQALIEGRETISKDIITNFDLQLTELEGVVNVTTKDHIDPIKKKMDSLQKEIDDLQKIYKSSKTTSQPSKEKSINDKVKARKRQLDDQLNKWVEQERDRIEMLEGIDEEKAEEETKKLEDQLEKYEKEIQEELDRYRAIIEEGGEIGGEIDD